MSSPWALGTLASEVTRSTRSILHADMDAFFASVEQRDDPSLRGKPVIVGGTGSRGVVAAASYEARKFGVHSAMPTWQARKLCPQGVYLHGNMPKYAAVSRQIRGVFEEFTDLIEPLALDEAFLDITHSAHLFEGPEALARRLKARVREETDLAVSVGLGPNKLLAKIACGLGKPDGLYQITEEEATALLAKMPIRKLWGIGPKAEERLLALGIETLGALRDAPVETVRKVFGRHAEAIQARAMGHDERPVETERAPKSIGEESTFPGPVAQRLKLVEAIVEHSETVASRARRAGYLGQTVTLKIKFEKKRPGKRTAAFEIFEGLTRQKRLDRPTDDAMTIRKAAESLLQSIELESPVRLLGVTLSALRRAETEAEKPQLSLFPVATEKPPGRPSLGAVMDQVHARFGANALRRAVDQLDKMTASDREKVGELLPEGDESTPKSPKVPRPGRR